MLIMGNCSALSSLIKSTPLENATLIELLEVGQSAPGTDATIFHAIFGDDIVARIAGGEHLGRGTGGDHAAARAGINTPNIQILFLNSIRDNKGCTTSAVQISAQTLESVCNQLSVPLAFLDAVLRPSIWSKQSGGSFHRFNDEEELEAIDGFYHYFNEWHLGPLHTWFSYNVKSKCTTYLLLDCALPVKDKIIASAINRGFFSQPLAIDLLIAEECSNWRELFINDHYNQIFDWHERNGSMDPPLKRHVNTVDNLQRLHQLSRTWNMIYEDLGDLGERLDFLIDSSKKLQDAGFKTMSTIESLKFLRDRNQLRRRWVSSFGERTKLIIHFVFSIDAQANNQTNLEIANTSSIIAKETQKDNSSMITIATMTMLFLPGTFVSAIFSMVFFNYGVDSNGQEAFQVSSRLWLYFAVTVPLTLLVSGIYQYWRRQREGRVESRHKESGIDLEIGNNFRT